MVEAGHKQQASNALVQLCSSTQGGTYTHPKAVHSRWHQVNVVLRDVGDLDSVCHALTGFEDRLHMVIYNAAGIIRENSLMGGEVRKRGKEQLLVCSNIDCGGGGF